MQHFKNMNNIELLALLIGKRNANSLKEKSLLEVFNFKNTELETVSDEDTVCYQIYPALHAAKELLARCFLEKMELGEQMNSPETVKRFLCSRIGNIEHEVFWCLWLDAQNRLISAEQIFRGTLTQASVYPREIVKRALSLNAAAVILAHNHPSGAVTPSSADIHITQAIKSALLLIDTKVIDHLILAGTDHYSFAERGGL